MVFMLLKLLKLTIWNLFYLFIKVNHLKQWFYLFNKVKQMIYYFKLLKFTKKLILIYFVYEHKNLC